MRRRPRVRGSFRDRPPTVLHDTNSTLIQTRADTNESNPSETMGDSMWERRTNCRQLNVDGVYKELSWSGRLELGLLWPSDGGRDPAERRPALRSEGSHRENRDVQWQQQKPAPWALCFRVELLRVREFALSGPLFLQILYVPFVGCNLQPGQRLRFSSKQQNLDSCLSQTVASTHTQAAEPRTHRSHEGLWTRREDGL